MILSIIILIILLIYVFYSDSLSVNDFKKHIEDKPVLLIGNSPRVSDNMGSLIDSGKFNVIRFNNFNTNGYEDKIGTKTDIWIMNELVCCSNPSHKKYKKRFCLQVSKHIVYPIFKFFVDPFKRVPLLPSDSYFHKKYKFNDVFSSGMYTILLCLECGKIPYIYGFDLDASNPTDHLVRNELLFDKIGKLISFNHHNWSDEKKLLNNLIERNLVKQLF